MRLIHDIEPKGALFFLLNALIGAYNRRTDVMKQQADVTDKLNKLAKRLEVQNDALSGAVAERKPE